MMSKQAEYQKELNMWDELFTETTEQTQKAAKGLIEKAAYLHSLCWDLEQILNKTGAIKVHPDNPNLQKQIPAVKEYARLTETYANVVNKLNNMRMKNILEDDDELDEFA